MTADIARARDASLAHAYEAGRSARERGRDLSDCPLYAMGELGRRWRERWADGWHSLGPVQQQGRRR